jgi:Ig-fold domain
MQTLNLAGTWQVSSADTQETFPATVPGHIFADLHAAVDSHMNMVRIWGGGVYEQDIFYDLCDKLGLLLWQDFMFACTGYPVDDPAFLEEIRAEAEDNIRRIRHHACLALWNGNNELELGWDAGWGLVGDEWTEGASLHLEQPDITWRVESACAAEATVTVSTRKPALFVWFAHKSLDMIGSDNFFHMTAGETRRLTLRPLRGDIPDSIATGLEFHSLWNAMETDYAESKQ